MHVRAGNTYLIQTAGKVTSKEVVKEGRTARGQLRRSMSHIVSWRKRNVAAGDGRTQNRAGHAQCVRVVGAEYGCGKKKGRGWEGLSLLLLPDLFMPSDLETGGSASPHVLADP